MKQLYLRILALLLIIATILPLATACKKDPPPNKEPGDDNETENEGEEPMNSFYIDAVQTGAQTLTVADFSSQEMKDTNPSVSNALTSRDGRGVLILEASKNTVAVKFPQSHEVYKNYYYINFSVYSVQASDTVINIKFDNMSDKKITLDYVGWKDFSIKLDFFSSVMPFPLMTGLTVSRVSGSTDTVAYVSNITAIRQIYTLSVPDGVSLDDPALYSSITDTYREYLVGPETPADSDAYRKKATTDINNARNAWNQFKATSDKLDEPETLFNIKIFNIAQAGYGTPYKNGDQITAYYQKVAYMASGYGIPGSELYKNPELLADILTCLEYGYRFYYGEEIVNTSTTYGNWHKWRVTIPGFVLHIITIIKDDITQEQINKYLAPIDILIPVPWGAGANLLWMARCAIFSAALQKDAMRICIAKEFCSRIFTYAEDYEGPDLFEDGRIYRDGSFVQHTALAYTMAYGSHMLEEISTLSYCLKDSRFNFHGEAMNNQFEWLFNSYQPFMYEGLAMSTVGGREVSASETREKFNFDKVMIALIKMCQYAPAESKAKIEALIRYNMDKVDTDYSTSVAYPLIDYYIALKTNPAYSGQDPYVIAKVFGAMDRVVQHTPEYAVALALSSTRIYKYEAINGQNFTGWYQGDGALFIYTDGYSFERNFYGFANPYLMPGATVNLASRNVVAISHSFINSDPFAGGVQQGNYAAAGFILGYDYNSGLTHKTFKHESDSKITAKKSYFFFDNEIVCLGSDIKDESGEKVITTVDNRLWRSNDVLSVNGVSIAPVTLQTTTDTRTMHFTNMGGYVFLGNHTVSYKKATNMPYGSDPDSGADTRDFLEVTIEHGIGNSSLDGRYAYVYLPEATLEETNTYNANPDVEILHRSDTTHAVLEKKLGIVGCVFFEDFSDAVEVDNESTAVSYIESETPCAVMISKNADGSYTVSVSDPTQTYSSLKFYITIDGISEVVSADTGVSSSISGNTASVTVNCKGARGATFNVTIK